MRKERYFVLILSSDFYALKIIQKDFISLLFKTNLRKIKDDTLLIILNIGKYKKKNNYAGTKPCLLS